MRARQKWLLLKMLNKISINFWDTEKKQDEIYNDDDEHKYFSYNDIRYIYKKDFRLILALRFGLNFDTWLIFVKFMIDTSYLYKIA